MNNNSGRVVEARDDLTTVEVSQLTGMSDVDLTRRAKDGIVTPSGSSGRRGRGGSRTYSAADVGALDALAALRALGVPLETAKPIVNHVQRLPGWGGRRRCNGLVCLDFDDFPERLFYNGKEVSETEPSEAGAITLRVRPLVALQLVRSIVLGEEPYARFSRLRCLATRDDYIGESALSLLTRGVFGVKGEARDLASFLGFEKGSKTENVLVELCVEERTAFEKHAAADTAIENPSAAGITDEPQGHPMTSTQPRRSDGGTALRCETAKEAIETSIRSGCSSLWVGNPGDLIALAEGLGYNVIFQQGGQSPEQEAQGTYLCIVSGNAPSTPQGQHDWVVGVFSEMGTGQPAPVINFCQWCGRVEGDGQADVLRRRFAEADEAEAWR